MISSLIFMSLVFGLAQSRSLPDEPLSHYDVQDLLVPLHSITPLICDLVFNRDAGEFATWVRNGEPIAKVNSHSNHVYEDRPLELKEIPEVGFLIIPHILQKDESDYWCVRDSDGQMGKVFRIRVAYINKFDELLTPLARPSRPFNGDDVQVDCPTVDSFPPAAISWKFDEEPIDFSSGRLVVTTNGSLVIRQFRGLDAGVYECVLSNFAGQTSTRIRLSSPAPFDLNDHFDYALRSGDCGSSVRSGMLWFLIGCLTTSCVVLAYLLGGLICYKFSRKTGTQFTPLLLRADPTLAPGFRKVVAPVPDFVRTSQPTPNGFMEDV